MKKKIVSISMVVALLACIAAGTLAYFTASDTAKNTFTVGELHIALNERPISTVVEDDGTISYTDVGTADDDTARVDNNTYKVYPGAQNIPKDPVVWNLKDAAFSAWTDETFTAIEDDGETYKDSEYSAWVALAVTFNNAAAIAEALDTNNFASEFYTIDGDSWKLVGTPYLDGDNLTYYYYNTEGKILPGNGTSPLFEVVNIPSGMTSEALVDFELNLKAYAVQDVPNAPFADVDEAFTAALGDNSFGDDQIVTALG